MGCNQELAVEKRDEADLPAPGRIMITQFINEGFVRIDRAFTRDVADACRAILWKDLPCDRNNPRTWTRPMIRLLQYGQEPFRQAINTPALHLAYDALAGTGRWIRPGSVGTFPIRFPSRTDPGDTGWHVDAAFPGKNSAPGDYMSWRINVNSRGRALLMLLLFSDISGLDAPTRLRVGSHLDVARILAPAGEEGMSFLELAAAANRNGGIARLRQVLAVGEAGTAYLCHPFMLHAAQRHRGMEPRFVAQPPLMPAVELRPFRENGEYCPVEQAIRLAVGLA
jgi:hypothetical protein